MPHLVEVQTRFQYKRVQVVGITAASRAEIQAFAPAQGINYPILTTDAEDMSAYGVRSIPITYLVDPSGMIVETGLDAIEKKLEAELGE